MPTSCTQSTTNKRRQLTKGTFRRIRQAFVGTIQQSDAQLYAQYFTSSDNKEQVKRCHPYKQIWRHNMPPPIAVKC